MMRRSEIRRHSKLAVTLSLLFALTGLFGCPSLEPLELTKLSIQPNPARAGVTLSIELLASQEAPAVPLVSVAGEAATHEGHIGTEGGSTRYTYTYEVTGNEPEGTVTVSAAAWHDDESNEITIEETVTLDFTPPSVTSLEGPTDPSFDSSATFTFDCSKSACVFSCNLEGETEGVIEAGSTCESGVTYDIHVNDIYTFSVVATDPAGNESEPAAWSWAAAAGEQGILGAPCRDDGTCNRGLFCHEAVCTQCDRIGFEPEHQSAWGADLMGMQFFFDYEAVNADGDLLVVYQDSQEPLNPGTYAIDAEGTAGFIVFIAKDCNDDECDYFLAVDGALIIDTITYDIGFFAASLENLVLVEMDSTATAVLPIEVADVWCIDEMELLTLVNRECLAHRDCTYADRPFCTSDGDCVQCRNSDDCPGEEICSDSACADLSTCDLHGFIPSNQHALSDNSFGPAHMFYQYEATNADGDVLKIELWGGAELSPSFEPGTLILGEEPSEHNYRTCTTCVLIEAGCAEDECDLFFAISGELVIEEIGSEQGEILAGSLRNAYFREIEFDDWGLGTLPVLGGRSWCIDEMEFFSFLNPCEEHQDCPDSRPLCGEDGICVQCRTGDDCEDLPHCGIDNTCLECLENEHCDDQIHAFCADNGLCVECLENNHCHEQESPYCREGIGTCVECTNDAHCDDPDHACLYDTCVIPPDGNTCDNPILLEGVLGYSGTFDFYTNNFIPGADSDSSCTGYTADGPDIVFEVLLEPGQTLDVTYTVFDADASLYIVSECLNEGEPPVDHSAVCLAGVDDTLVNRPERISFTNSEPTVQIVYVILDVYSFDPALVAWADVAWEADFTLTP